MPEPAGIDVSGVDLTTETVRTARLVIRPARPEDVDDVFRASQDGELQRWLSIPVPYSGTTSPRSSQTATRPAPRAAARTR